jgi:hypothetical protein
VLVIRYLQRKYKKLSEKAIRKSATSITIEKLILIQYILYFFKRQFSAWGYFHPSCLWTKEDEAYFRKLFPKKDFEEPAIVVYYNPQAITYYHNKIFRLSKGRPPIYEHEIKRQLIEWNDWN